MLKLYCEKVREGEESENHTHPLTFLGYFNFTLSEGEFNTYLKGNIQAKCLECRRPFMCSTKEQWRTYCPACYLLLNGIIVQCSGCEKRIPIYPDKKNEENFCRDCYKKQNGKQKVCLECFSTFYYIPKKNNDEDFDNCYDCFLKKSGIKKKCFDCKQNIYVRKETKFWKKRCWDCWLYSGKKKRTLK